MFWGDRGVQHELDRYYSLNTLNCLEKKNEENYPVHLGTGQRADLINPSTHKDLIVLLQLHIQT